MFQLCTLIFVSPAMTTITVTVRFTAVNTLFSTADSLTPITRRTRRRRMRIDGGAVGWLACEDDAETHGKEIGVSTEDTSMQWKVFEKEVSHDETDHWIQIRTQSSCRTRGTWLEMRGSQKTTTLRFPYRSRTRAPYSNLQAKHNFQGVHPAQSHTDDEGHDFSNADVGVRIGTTGSRCSCAELRVTESSENRGNGSDEKAENHRRPGSEMGHLTRENVSARSQRWSNS